MKRVAHTRRRGFTLVEVVLATGIFATVAIGMLALLQTAAESAGKAGEDDEVSRLIPAAQARLALAGGDQVKAWIDGKKRIYLYQYQADPAKRRDDGTPEPKADASGVPGRDAAVVFGMRAEGDAALEKDIAALDGRLFQITAEALAQETPPAAGQSGAPLTVLCRLAPVPAAGARPGAVIAAFPAAVPTLDDPAP